MLLASDWRCQVVPSTPAWLQGPHFPSTTQTLLLAQLPVGTEDKHRIQTNTWHLTTPASAVTPYSRCSHHALRFLHICLPSAHLLACLSCLITPGHSPVLTLIKYSSSLKSLRRQLQSHSENTGMKDQVLKLPSRTLDASTAYKEANICRRLCKRRAVKQRCLGCYHHLEEMPVTPGRGQVSCHCGYYFSSYYHHAHRHPCKRHCVHTKKCTLILNPPKNSIWNVLSLAAF